MKPGSKPRKVWVLIALSFGIGIIVFIWSFRTPEQRLTLSDGTVVTLRGAKVGTNYVIGSTLAKLIHRLPKPLSEKLVGLSTERLGVEEAIIDEGPCMILCLEGALGVGVEFNNVEMALAPPGYPPALEWSLFELGDPRFGSTGLVTFGSWPRRAEELDIVIFDGDTFETRHEVGRFRVRNPDRNLVPPWKAEQLPATRQSGDLEVRLLEFVSGISDIEDFGERGDEQYFSRYKVGIPTAVPGVVMAWEAKSIGRTNEHWAVERVALSDPTGNRIDGLIYHRTERTLAFAYTLWPDEPAWKLTMDLKRESGHDPNELLVFTNVPIPEVGGTNVLNCTNSATGLGVQLESFKHKPVIAHNTWSERGYSWVRLTHTPDLVLDFVSATADEGTTLRAVSDDHSEESYRVAFKDLPPSATKLNLTFAIQKLRRVEFFVAPNWLQGTNSFEYVEPASKR